MQGKTWSEPGKTPVIPRPGQRRGVSAASAVNAKGAFWFAACQGGLNGALFVDPLNRLMYRRKKPLHLVIDGLSAHKNKVVKDYVASTDGRLTLHFLPGSAPDPHPHELVWNHAKRTGVARRPLQKGEKLEERVHDRLQEDLQSAARCRNGRFRRQSANWYEALREQCVTPTSYAYLK